MHQVGRQDIPLSDGTWQKAVFILLVVCLDLDITPIMGSCMASGGSDVIRESDST